MYLMENGLRQQNHHQEIHRGQETYHKAQGSPTTAEAEAARADELLCGAETAVETDQAAAA
jgi:hypothetical protein